MLDLHTDNVLEVKLIPTKENTLMQTELTYMLYVYTTFLALTFDPEVLEAIAPLNCACKNTDKSPHSNKYDGIKVWKLIV